MTQQLFQLGEEASRKKFVANIEDLRSQGTGVLNAMNIAEIDTLLTFDRRLSSINAHRQRANRIKPYGVYAQFPVSDFITVDQGQSTATVRVDSRTATLRERQTLVTAVIKNKTFSSNIGTVQVLDQTNSLWTVTTDGASPTGTIDAELVTPVSLTLITMDIAASQSNPIISASASSDGITYINATSIDLSGYRINVWLAPMEVKYFRLQVTPALSDDPSGYNFTFGMTSFDATGVQYVLQSDLITSPVSFIPTSTQAFLNVPVDSNIQYYLSLADSAFIEVVPNMPIDLPWTSRVLVSNVVAITIKVAAYSSSLQVSSNSFVLPTVSNGCIYEATTTGVLQTVGEPTWPTVYGTQFTSGTVILTTFPNGMYVQNTGYPIGMKVRPTIVNGFVYEVTSPGTTQTTGEPVWPTIRDQSITSGSVTFVCRSAGLINCTLPTNTFINTVSVVENSTGKVLRSAPGLSPGPMDINLQEKYIGLEHELNGTWQMYLIRDNPFIDYGETYTVTYVTGPATMTVQLKVRLSTSDNSITPVFHGATLETAGSSGTSITSASDFEILGGFGYLFGNYFGELNA